MPLSVPQRANLSQAARAAVACEQSTGFPAEITVAQWALEAGWGNAMPGNNCFGIKAAYTELAKQLLPTTEWFTVKQAQAFLSVPGRTATPSSPPDASGRRQYACKDWFRSYPELADCFVDHSRIITTVPVYGPAWAQYLKDHNIDALVDGIAAHYATAPNYASTLRSIVGMPEVKTAIQFARSQAA